MFGWKLRRPRRHKAFAFFDSDGKGWMWWNEEEHQKEVEQARAARLSRYRKIAEHFWRDEEFWQRYAEAVKAAERSK